MQRGTTVGDGWSSFGSGRSAAAFEKNMKVLHARQQSTMGSCAGMLQKYNEGRERTHRL